jgi:hypothetical protein
LKRERPVLRLRRSRLGLRQPSAAFELPGIKQSGRRLPHSKAACGGDPAFHNPSLPSLREVLKIQFLTANERQWTRIPNHMDLINFLIRILLFGN